MSQNVDLVRAFIEATNAQEFDRYGEIVTENIVIHMPGGRLLDRAGREGNEKSFASAFPDLQRRVEDLIESGDKVVARTSLRGTHRSEFSGVPPTDKVVETSAIVIYRVAENRIVEQWIEYDLQGLLEQLNNR